MPKHDTTSQWVTTRELATALGVSNSFLWKNRETLFKQGEHWRLVNPYAWRPTYRWHLERCQKLMNRHQPYVG